MIFEQIGPLGIASRLRVLSEKLMKDAQKIYDMYDVALNPTWFPVFYYLTEVNGPNTITAISKAVGQSHPATIKIIKNLEKNDLITQCKDPTDGRKTIVEITSKGMTAKVNIQNQYKDIDSSVLSMLDQSQNNLWEAIKEFEYMLDVQPMYNRVKEQRKKRESASIKIVEYTPELKESFKSLNEEWIKKYFTMEESDRNALHFPEKYILSKGGRILFAMEGDDAIGTCALIKMNEKYDYELAKMAVSPKAQGKGVGYILGKACLDLAKKIGGRSVYLESNTKLTPALKLYEKLGFIKVKGIDSPYDRCDIKMAVKV